MIKTIKVKKQLRLDELLKYVWDSECKSRWGSYVNSQGDEIYVDGEGIDTSGVSSNTLLREHVFIVEVEEEITDDTVFQTLVAADSDGGAHMMYKGSIYEIRDSVTTEIRANINGKLELIWEAE